MEKRFMPDVTLGIATPAGAVALARISQRAFQSDVICGAPGDGGPPGYDSPAWQASIMNSAAYFRILLAGDLVGGAIVFDKGEGHYELGRVFLDPASHRQGIGLAVMHLLFAQFPLARKWTLDTPPWNMRTRSFYRKLGFRLVKETEADLFFEKVMA